jgi:hypothetical protein
MCELEIGDLLCAVFMISINMVSILTKEQRQQLCDFQASLLHKIGACD